LERKNDAQLDKSRNLIDVSAKKESGFYVLAFTKQLLTDDEVHDVNLGKPDYDVTLILVGVANCIFRGISGENLSEQRVYNPPYKGFIAYHLTNDL
jgi:hypothetical protein